MKINQLEKTTPIIISVDGGLNVKSIPNRFKDNELLEALNIDWKRARYGGAAKRKDTHRIGIRSHPDIFYWRPMHLFLFPVFHADENGDIRKRFYSIITGIEGGTDILKLQRPYKDPTNPFTDLEWTDIDLPDPIYNWGDNFTTAPIQVLADPTPRPDPLGKKRYDQFLYLFSDKKIGEGDNQENASQIYIKRTDEENDNIRHAITDFRVKDVVAADLRIERVLGGPIEEGTYRLKFLTEDYQGNIGTVNDDEHIEFEMEGSGGIKITLLNLQKYKPGLKYFYVFRTLKSGTPNYDADTYYLIASTSGSIINIDEISDNETSREYRYSDTAILDAGITINQYYNQNQPPKALLPPNQITMATVHHGHLFCIFENQILYSMKNLHRNFHRSDYQPIVETELLTGIHSFKNNLFVFAEDGVWIWRGRSVPEMGVLEPEKIANIGVKYNEQGTATPESGYDSYSKWNDTIRESGDRLLFVDKDGYPKQIIGDKVLNLSSDGLEKLQIPNVDQVDAIVANDKYLITTGNNIGEKWMYSYDLEKNRWSIWDIRSARKFMNPFPIDKEISEFAYNENPWEYEFYYLDWDSNLWGYGRPVDDEDLRDDHCDMKLGTGWIHTDCQMISFDYRIDEYGLDSSPQPFPMDSAVKEIVEVIVFLDGEDSSSLRLRTILESDRFGVEKTQNVTLNCKCRTMRVRIVHISGEKFELSNIKIYPKDTGNVTK